MKIIRRRGPATTRPVPILVLAFVLLQMIWAGQALADGTVTGTVTDAAGPVAAARVLLETSGNFYGKTTTAADGSFSIAAMPGTYTVGVYPPAGSADSFSSRANMAVTEGAATDASMVLAPSGPTHVSGTVHYPGNPPDAGVKVTVYQERLEESTFRAPSATTDEAGNWDVGSVVAGFYRIEYSLPPTPGSNAAPFSLATEVVALEGADAVLSREVSGPLPGGSIEATATNAEGWPMRYGTVTASGNGISPGLTPDHGHFSLGDLPGGTYQLTAEPESLVHEYDLPASVTVTVNPGQTTRTAIQTSPMSALPGVAAQNEQRDLAYLNEERAQWGLPAGLMSVPLWSQACASHDAYQQSNKVLEHQETPGRSDYSDGGRWAGGHAVLSEAATWTQHANPWMDAPFHLEQLFAPLLLAVGLDDSNGYQCATTWPGMLRPLEPAGTVHTFPGDGTSGLPPVEYAAEFPSTPNEALGLPPLTGRQLIVWEETGDERNPSRTHITSASLASPGGPVEVKTLIGAIGAFVIPVKPLEPFTTYTATVTLMPVVEGKEGELIGPPVVHSWSFTTGADNPGGHWEEGPTGKKRGKARRLHVHYGRGHVIVKGSGFEPGRVVLRGRIAARHRRDRRSRHPKKRRVREERVLARAQANGSGRFTARFRWPKERRVAIRVTQGTTTTPVAYRPRKPRHHRHSEAKRKKQHGSGGHRHHPGA